MDDIFTTVIAIMLSAILLFIFPLMTMADRTDDAAQLTVKTATNEFVDEIRATGKITPEAYSKYLGTITSTNDTFDVAIKVDKMDSNLGKKTSQAVANRTGSNAYVTYHTSQILDEIFPDASSGGTSKPYMLSKGDFVSVSAKNTNLTLAQQLKNVFYTVTGNNTYTIVAEHGGVVTTDGK